MKPRKKNSAAPLSDSQVLAPSLFRQAQTWHTLVVASVQIVGLTAMGWSALSVWLVFLCDDLGLAASTWVRTAWARTKAREGVQERAIAVVGHALIDLVTLAGLAAGLFVMTHWPENETFARAYARVFGAGEQIAVLTALGFSLLQWPAWWHNDRSGSLIDIDEIRASGGLLTRFWVANLALLLGLPWMGGSAADLAATLILVALRSVWTLWFDARMSKTAGGGAGGKLR